MILFPPIRPRIAHFTDSCRIPCNLSYDLIRCVKYLCRLRILSVCSGKPFLQTLPTAIYFICNQIFLHFHIDSRNQQFILYNFFQQTPQNLPVRILQTLFYKCGIDLQTPHETSQILDQTVFEHKKLCRFHHFFRFYTVQLPHIILIILIQSYKIIIQIIPPCIYMLLICFCNLRNLAQIDAKSLQ